MFRFLLSRFVLVVVSSVALVSVAADRPNIIFIMVDDMGYHDLGCYGSKTILTPNIDKMASEGIRFTHAYSGGTVCASARSTLMTGTHKGQTPVRGNSGGIPLFPSDVTVAEVVKTAGYTTGGFGKWGLGNQGHDGAAERQGFDTFFGYYNQWHAHTYYTHLFRNSERVELNGRYTHHAIFDETIKFIKENHEKPFFLYCPWTPPHAAYEIPDTDPAWALYKDKPWKHDARCAAAMDSMMDRQVGEITALLKELNIYDNTIMFFTSDNGAAKRFEGVHDSCGVMKGFKRSMQEGGIRVPMVVRWPGKIEAGQTSDFPWYFPDVLPTFAELTGAVAAVPELVTGISVLPTILGTGEQKKRDYMFWQFGKQRAVRIGKWKGIGNPGKIRLYDVVNDMAEDHDLAAQHPEIADKISKIMESAYREQRSQKDDGKYTGKPKNENGAADKKKKKKG